MLQRYFPDIQHFFLLVIALFFVFSGAIKLLEPADFSWKIAAYLSSFSRKIHKGFLRFIPYTFPIAVAVCVLEIVLGGMLLCNYKTIFVLFALLGLTVFFTLLAVYTMLQQQIDSCGCLSEAIPLTPTQSFMKNIVLLVLLTWLCCTYQTMV